MVSLYDPNTVRRVEIEVYLPRVLANLVLQYFSQKFSSGSTIEDIYSRNESTGQEEGWQFEYKKELTCSLCRIVKAHNQWMIIGLRTFQDQRAKKCRLSILFHQTRFKYNTHTVLCATQLRFSSVCDRQSYRLDSVFSTDYPAVAISQYVKILDDGISEFQHPALLNIKSLLDAHKDDPQLSKYHILVCSTL